MNRPTRAVILSIVLTAILGLPRSGWATTITFEGAPSGVLAGTEYAGLGVVFSSIGGVGAQEYNYGGAITEVITSDDWYHPLRIDFVNPANSADPWVVSSVSMENHFDEDYWLITAYDGSNNLLSTQILSFATGVVTFSGIGPIHSVILDAHTTAFAMDNLTFDGLSGAAVPEPGTIFLVASGLAGMAFRRNKRQP